MGYRGEDIPIILAKYGLVGASRISDVPPGALIQAKNVKFSRGTLDRSGGSSKYNATPIVSEPHILGMLDWWPTNSDQRLLVYTDGGAILRDDGSGTFAITMKSGLNTGIPVWLTCGQESLGNVRVAMFTNGLNTVQVVSGDAAATADIAATKPADWSGFNQPRFFTLHSNRVWAGLGHWIYASTPSNHCDFTSEGSAIISVYPGQGQYIQGGFSWQGRLWILKWPLGLYWLDDSSAALTDWICHQHTKAVGLAGPNAHAVTDNDVFFLGSNGHIMRLSGIQEFGDVRNADVTALNDLIEWTRENVNVSQDALEVAEARYYDESKEVHFAVRGIGSAVKNLRIIVDLNSDIPRIRTEDKDVCEALAIRQDILGINRLVCGDDTGTVWDLDQDDLSVDGVGYQSQFQTPHDDFSWVNQKLASRDKNFQALEVVMRPVGNYDLSVDVWIDGNYTHTVTFNMGYTGAALGTFVLGTDVLGGDVIRNVKHRLRGSGRRLSLLGRVFDVGANFRLSEVIVSFTPGGDKPL